MEPSAIFFVILGIFLVGVTIAVTKAKEPPNGYNHDTEEMKEKRSHCSNCGERYEWSDFRYNHQETRQYSSYSDPITVYSIIAKCHKCKHQSGFCDLEMKPKVEKLGANGQKYIRDSRWSDVITKYFNISN